MLIEPVKLQGFGRAAATLIQGGDKSISGADFCPLFFETAHWHLPQR